MANKEQGKNKEKKKKKKEKPKQYLADVVSNVPQSPSPPGLGIVHFSIIREISEICG